MLSVTKKSFTLIELLVVIAIIGILTSILLPSLSKAREKTKSSVCKSNERQIGIASVLWSDENNGKTLAAAWYRETAKTSLTPYTGTSGPLTQQNKAGIYHCPSLDMAQLVGTFVEDYRFTSYATNQLTTGYFFDKDKPFWQIHGVTTLAQIIEPARKVSFMESTHYQIGVKNYHPHGTPAKNSYNRWHPLRKGLYGKSNILWYDGHVTGQPGDFTRNDWQDYYFDPDKA